MSPSISMQVYHLNRCELIFDSKNMQVSIYVSNFLYKCFEFLKASINGETVHWKLHESSFGLVRARLFCPN